MRTIPLSEYAQVIAKEEGLIEGREEGREEGRKDGLIEGKFEVARKMLARKISVGEIVDITGLNERDILSIQ